MIRKVPVEELRESVVLVVDDEAANVHLLEAVLSRQGYSNVHSTTDSSKALEVFRETGPDIVLLDLMMPEPDGFAVLASLSDVVPEWSYLPILILTADNSVAARNRALSGGATDFLTKPLDMTEVTLRIHNLLETRHLYKRLALELAHAQRLETVGRLASSITHDILTPVQYVSQNTEFLATAVEEMAGLIRVYREVCGRALGPEDLAAVRAAEDAADVEFAIQDAAEAARESLDGLDHITTIARAMKTAGRQDDEEQAPSDLNALVRSALAMARTDLKYVASVEADLGDLPPVVCHPASVVEVVLNLLTNAKDAIAETVAGTKELGAVAVATRLDGGDAVVSVSDTGGGIPPEVRDRVFAPFFSTKPTGVGSGQGLPIIRAIVEERHGGSITFETTFGQGTTFSVRLPVSGRPEPPDSGT